MRKVPVSSLSFLALAALAACSSAPDAESIGATHDALDLPSGGVTVATESCSSLALGGLAPLCGALGVCSGVSDLCDRKTRQLFTGTELLPSHATPPSWGGFGGRGRMFADSGLCMLRDLGTSGPITMTSGDSVVSAHQTVGFLSFDPTNKIFKGYRQMSVCLPLLGCLDMRPQTFSVTERRAFTSGTFNGSYPIFGEAALEISADETSRGMTISPPAIPIITPYGTISVQPAFTYSGGDQMLSSAFQNETWGPGMEDGLTDLYGMTPGTTFTGSHTWLTGAGWDSLIALGSRLSASTWSGTGSRPDSDFSTARNAAEQAPGVPGAVNGEAISVSADIVYSLPISSLPAPVQSVISGTGIEFTFDIYVKPHYDTKFAGELQFQGKEEAWWWMDTPKHESLSSLNLGTSIAHSSSLSIQAGVDLVFKIDIPLFGPITIINVHPTFDQPISSSAPTTALGPAAVAEVTQADASTPYTTTSAWNATYSKYQTLTSNGQNLTDPDGYINACLATAPPAKTIPAGKYTPPNPGTLPGAEFPCNVCYANAATTWTLNGVTHTLPAETKVLEPSSNGQNWSCNVAHAGCFDMCTWNQATNQMVVAQSAATFNFNQCSNGIH